jgi:hypothetical protein
MESMVGRAATTIEAKVFEYQLNFAIDRLAYSQTYSLHSIKVWRRLRAVDQSDRLKITISFEY